MNGWHELGMVLNNKNNRVGKGGYQEPFIMSFDQSAILADAAALLNRPATAADSPAATS